MAWIFADERDAYALAVADHVERRGAFVPALWRWEVQNTLLSAARRRRITYEALAEHLIDLQSVNVAVESASQFGVELSLAREHRLSVYDAAYLEVAIRRGLPLATTDEALARAARAERVFFTG